MKKKELNPRQRKFCILRAGGMSQIDAYKKAGYKGTFQQASDLEAKKYISEEIRTKQDAQEEKLFDLIKECRQYAPDVVKSLAEQVQGNKKTSAVRLGASRELLDRGFGKPQEHLDLSGGFQLIVHYPPKEEEEKT